MGIHFYDPFYSDWVYCGGRYYYWRGVSYPAYKARYSWDYSYVPEPYSVSESSFSTATPISFPPGVPPLDTPPPANELNPGSTTPAVMSAYLGEPFYATLSTRLLLNTLLDEQRQSLYLYRDERDAELARLLRELDLAAGKSGEQSEALLLAFSEQQTPHLRELEAKAEDLRVEFLRRGLAATLIGSGGWADRHEYYQRMAAGATDQASKTHLDSQLLRAAAYYQDGLSRAQRELLCEAAEELKAKAYQLRGGVEESAGAVQQIAFSPSGARLPIGQAMPQAIVSLVQEYADRKSALKQALVDKVFALAEVPDAERTRAYALLAHAHATAVAECEHLAEEIRREIALAPTCLEAEASPEVLPPALVARIADLSARQTALARDFSHQFRLFSQAASPVQVRVLNLQIEDPDPSQPPQLTLGPATRMSEQKRSELRERIRLFNESNRTRHQALADERSQILEDISRAVRAPQARRVSASPEALFEDCLQHARSREVAGRYDYYRLAMLKPGLSPEQRRLLWGAALARLELPLPTPE